MARKLIVAPEAGTEGTYLVITDSGFGNGKGKVQVGGTPCKVKSWSDTEVACLIKEVIPPGLYDVEVIPKNGEAKLFVGSFTVESPAISSVQPGTGAKGTRVTISGSYWGTKKGTVTVGGVKAKVLRWVMGATSGTSSIDIKIPKLDPGPQDIVVEAPTGTVTLAGGFTVE